jgi:hypothetical protein
MINDVMCEVFTAPSSNIMFFVNVTPCGLVDALLMPLISSVPLAFLSFLHLHHFFWASCKMTLALRTKQGGTTSHKNVLLVTANSHRML